MLIVINKKKEQKIKDLSKINQKKLASHFLKLFNKIIE